MVSQLPEGDTNTPGKQPLLPGATSGDKHVIAHSRTTLRQLLELRDEDSLEEALVGTHFYPEQVYQEAQKGLAINEAKIVDDFETRFAEIQQDSRMTFLGLNHGSSVSHEKSAELLSHVRDKRKTVVAVEYPPDMQPSIDLFLATGKFRAADNPALYEKIYAWMRKEKEDGIPTELHGTIFDELPEFIDVLPILERARKEGIRVVAFDKHFREFDTLSENQRDEGMMEVLESKTNADDRVVCIIGGNHASYRTYTLDGTSNVPVASLAKQRWGEKVKSFYLENHRDYEKYEMAGQHASSVLFECMKDRVKDRPNKNVMLNIDEQTFPEYPELSNVIASEYYVPIGLDGQS